MYILSYRIFMVKYRFSVLIIFSSNLKTIMTAQMLTIGGEGEKAADSIKKQKCAYIKVQLTNQLRDQKVKSEGYKDKKCHNSQTKAVRPSGLQACQQVSAAADRPARAVPHAHPPCYTQMSTVSVINW